MKKETAWKKMMTRMREVVRVLKSRGATMGLRLV